MTSDLARWRAIIREAEIMADSVEAHGLEQVSPNSPAASFIAAIKPQIDKELKEVDLDLTIKGEREIEVTFIETVRRRRTGLAGRALAIVTRAADELGVALVLHAYFATGTGARRVLDQSALEQFYQRRGFKIIDPSNKERWMRREPA